MTQEHTMEDLRQALNSALDNRNMAEAGRVHKLMTKLVAVEDAEAERIKVDDIVRGILAKPMIEARKALIAKGVGGSLTATIDLNPALDKVQPGIQVGKAKAKGRGKAGGNGGTRGGGRNTYSIGGESFIGAEAFLAAVPEVVLPLLDPEGSAFEKVAKKLDRAALYDPEGSTQEQRIKREFGNLATAIMEAAATEDVIVERSKG